MPDHKMPRASVQSIGDVDLSYLEYNGDKDTLIFLHATGFLPWLWHPIAREMGPSRRVIAPYFCDHRHTEPEEGGLDWLIIARDFAEFCKGLGIKRPCLIGHSMGATVLTLAAAMFGIDPKGMILIEPIFLPQDFYKMQITVEQHPLASRSIKRRDSWEDSKEASQYLKSKSLFSRWDDEMIDLYIRYGMKPTDTGGLQLTCSPRKEASLFMGGMTYDPWPLIPEVNCPVLVLEGSESENRQIIDLEKASSMFSRGTYRLIRGAGHLIPMEKPHAVTEIIKGFFSGLD